MRLGHALFSVFVREDRGSCGVKMRIVVGMVEVPVGVDDVFQRCAAKVIESLFSLGQAGATKVSTTNLPSGPLSTVTAPPGPSNIVTLSASFCVSMGRH